MFIKDQTINWWKMSTIDEAFDIAETDVNLDIRSTLNIEESEDLFYSFCGC